MKIPVPRPPKSAMDRDRRVSTLLKNQILHLQEAEFRLPARAQTNIYVNAIKTEGEAADYIQQVTRALHSEHGIQPQGNAPAIAVVRKRRPARGLDIAAVAEEKPTRTAGKRAHGTGKSARKSAGKKKSKRKA
jgi:hypothetical protein